MIGVGTTIFLVNPVNFGGGSSFTNDYSMQFDGVDESVDLGRITMLEGASAATISLWVKFPATGTSYAFGKYASATNEIWIAKDSSERLRVDISGNGVSSSSFNGVLSLNTWHHIVFRFDGSLTITLRGAVYLNGSVVGNNNCASTLSTFTNNSYIGALNIGNYGNCIVDEVSIFDYALTSGQVTSLYNSGVPTDLDNTSGVTAPVHWWRMGDGSDSYDGTNWTINDVGTTGGNNGTSANMEVGDRVTDVP